jgi:hypothetical protein
MDTILAISTIALAIFTAFMAKATHKLAKESREASFRQICVQMWLEFQKRFDSHEMIGARKILAIQFKLGIQDKGTTISETVLNFFEDLGIAYEKGYIEKELAYDSFSYHVCRWWAVLKLYVYKERKRHNDDASLFVNFEKLANKLCLPNEIIDDRELQLFLEDESGLVG